MNRIRRGSPKKSSGRIPSIGEADRRDVFVRFSFKHLDLAHPKFNPARCREGYIAHFLERLREISRLSLHELSTNKSKSLRSHQIDFSQTSEPNGFATLGEQLQDAQPWQFEITKSAHGRVHGILLDDTFYVVWIDPEHLLYS